MRVDTLEILRCPYCGGRLTFVSSVAQARSGDEIEHAVLQCGCSWFPLVAGIPVMHLEPPVAAALGHLEAGRPDLARRTMFNLSEAEAQRFESVLASGDATYARVVDSLGPNYERGYFLYRFSDPSYVVAHALIRAVAGTALASGGRAIDLCGGSGHLTRALMDLSAAPPVLADLYFAKIWLGRTFTAQGCEGVCCHADAPLPFSRAAFRYAMCADAFMFIWTKRRMVQEMLRLVDHPDGAVVISHTHNQLQWSESLGQALPPGGYRELFETVEPRIFSERGLFADVVRGGPLDLSRVDSMEALEQDPAMSIVAARNASVLRPHPLEYNSGLPGEWRVNPLYVVERRGGGVQLRLQFPSSEYEEEFGACREYLPAMVEIDDDAWSALAAGRVTPRLDELVKRRVILDLPGNYY
jgi:uncharacterized protein YbaR (Trm112 family)/ubiquinone/menaquinone biosynthesis C-methylase UbiE